MFDYANFDFENYDYLYHETNLESAIDILGEGLYVEGTNILGAKNIIETTTLPLPYEDKEELEEFFASEKSISKIREVNAVVILGCPKEINKQIAEVYDSIYQGDYYSHVIPAEYIMGYCDLERMEFYANPYYAEYESPTFRM